MRTIAYVDGFNLYYGSLKRSPHKWLDICQFFRNTLPVGHTLEKVKYFTARVSALPNDLNAPIRQDAYLRALRAHCGATIEIIFGHFSVQNIRRPLTADPTKFAEIIKTEEKGSDVNLSVELVNDAWRNSFDCAAVVSNDADLVRGMQIVKQQLKKRVILYTPGAPRRFPLASLRMWSHKQLGVLDADLAASQLPPSLQGGSITKPKSW